MKKTIKLIVLILLLNIFLIFSMPTYSRASALENIIQSGKRFYKY